jgi:RNA polymerase sigma factor (sigma-70 family)
VAQSGPSTADQVVRRDLSRRIWDKVDRLPKQQRAAMILKFGEDLKIDEIAIILGKSPGAVKLLLHRATGRLRGEMAEVEVMA